jgi:hypothetical protein
MYIEPSIILLIIIFILIIIIYACRYKKNDYFSADVTTTSEQTSKMKPSYWYSYYPTDTRSKCFDCDRTSPYQHGTNCFDCEIPGGRKVNSLLNRVLTR